MSSLSSNQPNNGGPAHLAWKVDRLWHEAHGPGRMKGNPEEA